MRNAVDRDMRALLVEVTGLPQEVVDALPDDAPLLSGELGLGSRAGARLLLAVEEHFGVDVAQEDLALRSLASIASLVQFVRERLS